MIKLTHIFFFLFISSILLAGNQEEINNLKQSLNSGSDTSKILVYNKLANQYRIASQLDSAKFYANSGLQLAQTKDWKYGTALSFNNLAYISIYESDLESAMKNAVSALKIGETSNDIENLGFSYLYIGYINNILNEKEEVLSYYYNSLNIRKQLNNNYNLGFTYSYIGNYFLGIKNYDSAQHYHSLALETRIKSNDTRSIGDSYLLLGSAFFGKKMYDKAIKNYALALEKYESINDSRRLAETYRNYSEVFMRKDELGLAEHYLNLSLAIAFKIGAIDNLIPIHNDLAVIQEKKTDYEKAYNHLKQHIQYKDSLESNNVYREVTKQILKYKQAKEEEIKRIQNQKEEETQEILFISITIGFILVVVFLIFVYNRLQITKKQKLVIEEQKKKVENQKEKVESVNQEIKDSIKYAKRIQSAILPPDTTIKENLKDSFILYKPKDIVAGDFYWMESTNETVLFAAADCTGHGVPGAMVSVVCNNALNRSVREYGLRKPGEILDKTRELVIEEFSKSHEEVKDGMDIALCSLKGNSLSYAGANNPLWIIRNGEIIETKANKQPIGKFHNPHPYNTHSFELQKGDTVYLFSDGYVDQFGGEKGKKFMHKRFRALLLSIQDKTMNAQKELLNTAFENWRGHLEQIDDVCVIGARI